MLANPRASAGRRCLLAVLHPRRGRRPPRRARPRRLEPRRARDLGRTSRPAAGRGQRHAPCGHARSPGRTAGRRAGRDRRPRRDPRARLRASGRLRPRRRRVGVGMNLTLGEGGTPLVHAPRLSEGLGCDLWLKWEGANPTGSFKDRGMALAVGRAADRGVRGVICASTGNTAASAAAYDARAGMQALVLIPAGAVARGKLAQVVAAGAELRELDGSFDDAHALARRLAEEEGSVNVNSINPDRIEGQASAAHEVVEQLGAAPDVLALPYGGGGNTSAYARGFA